MPYIAQHNLMTVQTAALKKCHKSMARVPVHQCLVTQCMAWRFVPVEHVRPTELWSKSKNERVNSAFADDGEWRPIGPLATAEPPPPVGYCADLAPPE